jgi:hypothetical protein
MNKKTATLLPQRGVDITFIAFQLWFNNHPVCANKVLKVIFFMAQPPLLWPGGAIPDRNILLVLGAQ